MRIIKLIIMLSLIFFMFLPCTVNALESDESIEEINEVLDSSSDGVLTENDISVENSEKIFSANIGDTLSWVWGKVTDEIAGPIRLLSSLLTIILLSSLVGNMYSTGKMNSCSKTAETAGVLISVITLTEPVSSCFLNAANIITDGGSFMLVYVPVMAGVMTAQGYITTAGSYQLTVLTFCEIAVQISSSVLIPALSICFSVGIVDAVNPGISLGGLISGLKKTVTFILGLIMTLFTGLLALQSTAGGAADNLSVRTGKYLVSNLVPVVGKAVSDAYSTVYGSLGVLKTGIGTVGVTVFVLMAAVPLIKLFLYRAVTGMAAVAADILALGRLKKLFSDIESVFGIIISIDLVFSLMLVISTVTVMKTGSGA